MKNLISLCALDSKGYQISIKGGALKVVLGAMIVMNVIRQSNLYFLQGSTVLGGATTICNSIGEEISDTIRLWHMSLGHDGEKAMRGLVKQILLKGAKTWKMDFCEHCVMGK